MANAGVTQQINNANANREAAIRQQQQENDYLNGQRGNYNALEGNYRNQADTAYSDLAETPGYTADQAKGIYGNPNAAFKYYNPGAIGADLDASAAGINTATGNYAGDIRDKAAAAGSGFTDAASRYSAGVTGRAGKYSGDLAGAAGKVGSGLNNAADIAKGYLDNPSTDQLNWQGGVYGYQKGANEANYGNLDTGLNKAVDPSKLGLSGEFSSKYALSPGQAQNIKDVAGNTVRGQYQREQDQLGQRAFAQGNSSPAQIAALQQQLGRQGAIDAGDAMSTAELNANKEAAARQQSIENMRLGTEEDISNRLTGNATTRYGAANQASSNLAANELAGINSSSANRMTAAEQEAAMRYNAANTGSAAGYDAAKTGGAAGLNAEATAGQAGLDAAKVAGQYNYDAANSGGVAGINAANTIGTQRLNTDTGQQQVGQGLAINADNSGSARSGTVANQSIAGQNAVRGYYTGQQGAAQQGAQTATGQGIQSAGTQGALANQATNTATGAATSESNKPGIFSKILGAAGGILGGIGAAATGLKAADGAVVDKPTMATIGERGPEMIVPVGPRKRYRAPMEQMAA